MLQNLDTIVGYICGYCMLYAILAGLSNAIIAAVSEKRQENLLSTSGGTEKCIEYVAAASHNWIVRINANYLYAPLANAIAILLWPVYLPTYTITAWYYILKYLKT